MKTLEPATRAQTTTLAVWLDTWQGVMCERGRWSPATQRRHRGNARWLVRLMGNRFLPDLTVEHVEALDAALRADGLAPKSRANVHGTLRQALGHACRVGLLDRNVAALAGGPTAPRPEVLVPTDGQVSFLLTLATCPLVGPLSDHSAPPAWVHPFLRLAAYTGARPGELAALRWADVDLTRRELLIRATARADANGRGYEVGETTKTGHARRIALDEATNAALARWWPVPDDPTRALVFPVGTTAHEVARPLPAHLPRRWFKRLADRAGIDPRCTLYSLRHWHATDLLRRGVPVNVVADRLGHANPMMTLNVYGRHVPAGDRAAADAIDRG